MANEPFFSPLSPEAVFTPDLVETPAEVDAVVTPPVVEETPVAETIETPTLEAETVEVPPIVETPAAVEVIKEVEKIVEKYPEMDEYTKEIFDALLEGKEDVLLNYLSEKNRDYNSMSDYDAVKASIKKLNPNYTDEIAELKMERQYGELVKIDTSKLDPIDNEDELALAQAHNKKVDENLKLLKLDAFDARINLNNGKKDIKLPKIEKQEQVANNAPTPEAIEQGRKDWQEYVDKSIPEVKDFTYKVGDEEVSYSVSDAERKQMSTLLKESNGNQILQELGWIDKEGKQNVSKIAGDVLKLKKLDMLISNAYTQGKTAGTTSTVEGIKNIDLKTGKVTSVADQPFDIGKHGFGHLNPK